MELLIPTCNCFIEENHEFKEEKYINKLFYEKPSFISSAIITGTIYGNRRGKVSLCIQTNPKSMNPILLLEMAVPTSVLAKEMKGGFLRIALECNTMGKIALDSNSLLSMPLWTMYCNGRKVGFAVKRKPSRDDIEVLQQMESVVVGAGVINGKKITRNDDIMYLRGNFERVHGSYDSESFHLIDPDGNIGQELSIFFLRSR
ncbi:hypothetical protein Fot_25711 [Forsythia ovata]|uniref:Protein MIZU-KUSSEI 1-like n=1 Tax=Forsythia ovata TaxID=205694 RepID=A0ABD1U9T3_9LAMI